MAKYEKLSNSISVAEMMHMREVEGLSNQEIAERIGATNKTVYRYIGAQPAGLRKKWTRKDKLPALPAAEQVLPEMPRKSFAQRLEESYKKPVPVGTIKIPEKVKEDIERKLENGVVAQQPLNLAGLARDAHKKELEKTSTPYTTYKEEQSHIPELIAMFGSEAVITWLKVSLYDMGIPDCRPMNRQNMLEALKLMNAGGTNA